MRLAPFLGVFLAFGLYFSTQCPPSGSAPRPGTDARACDAGGLVPLAPPAEEKSKPKPSEKGKPRPPSPDALPTYELAARASGLTDLLRISPLV